MKSRSSLSRLAAAMIGLTSMLAVASVSANNIRWTDGAFSTTDTLAPGKVVEHCGEINPREPVSWKFSADGPLSYNIHRHADKEVIYAHRSYNTRELNGLFKPTLQHEWCWMWTNETSQPLTLRIEMKRE
jgi:hypothetical protein